MSYSTNGVFAYLDIQYKCSLKVNILIFLKVNHIHIWARQWNHILMTSIKAVSLGFMWSLVKHKMLTSLRISSQKRSLTRIASFPVPTANIDPSGEYCRLYTPSMFSSLWMTLYGSSLLYELGIEQGRSFPIYCKA